MGCGAADAAIVVVNCAVLSDQNRGGPANR